MAEFPFGLEGRVAIVTGGGTGIGTASARLLASFGADVVLASRKLENLERVADELKTQTGRSILAVQTDVRDESSALAMVERTIGELGRVDVLLNNAGGSYMFPFLETPVDRYDNNMDLNLADPTC